MPKNTGQKYIDDGEEEDTALVVATREELGKIVRGAWIGWAQTQLVPKPSWLLPWDEMEEKDREADRLIGDALSAYLGEEHEEMVQSLRRELKSRSDAHNRDINRGNLQSVRAEVAERFGNRMTGIAISLVVLLAGAMVCAFVSWPDPVVCPPPVECPVCEAPSAAATETATAGGDGYFFTDAEGMPHFQPWPDATGYDAATFEADCTDVCAVPPWAAGGRETRAGRVLMTDPAHLVCICFNEDIPFSPVQRWIGWERSR